MLRQSPRRNGRNKGLKVKHVVQISMLLGVSIWLLYQAHHSDDKKTSVKTNVSHKLNNVSSDDVLKLGRKVLRPKVKGTKEHQADEKSSNENKVSSSEEEDVIEDHESDEHEEVKENEKENGDKGHEESGLENENVQMNQRRRHEGKESEKIKGTANKNQSYEQNGVVVMEKIEKEVEMSTPSKEDDDQSVRDEVESDKMMNNGENDDQSREDDDQSKRPSMDHNEEDNKDLYSLEPNTANTMKSTWNDKNMKPDTDSEAQDKIGESIPSTEFEQKDGVSMLEEEKDALTDLETLPESGTGGSIIQDNAATE